MNENNGKYLCEQSGSVQIMYILSCHLSLDVHCKKNKLIRCKLMTCQCGYSWAKGIKTMEKTSVLGVFV